ncbi:MAG: hypothetical protein F2554_03455, partial [Actinobacteria bacterium]|nr:hypothetical protein [Actinomycetota bacterium]
MREKRISLLTLLFVIVVASVFVTAPPSQGGTYTGPSAPRNVTQSSSVSGITLSWDAPSSGTPNGYSIERSTNGTSWTSAGTTSSSTRTITVLSGLSANTAYYFRVRATSASGDGAWGYPWTEIYRTVSANRNSSGNIDYVSGYGLSAGNAAANYKSSPGTTSFSRIRYRLATTVNSVSRYADVDFEKWTSANMNAATGSAWTPDIDSIRIPTTISPNQFTVHANVVDLTINTDSPDVRNGYGISGRLEIWPWNYGTTRSGLNPAGDTSTYDYDDSPSSNSGSYGSFQVHTLEDLEPVFVWNRHGNGQNAEVGYGSRSTGNPDWTFCGDSAGVCTPSSFQLSIFVNPPITTASSLKPDNTALPSISGTTTFGQTLSVSTGSWANSPTSYSYLWSRSSAVDGTYNTISGATSPTYSLSADDVGKFLRVTVVATNSAGSTTAFSNASAEIAKANQAAITAVTLSATAKTFPYNESVTVTSITGGTGTGVLSVLSVANGTASGCAYSGTTLSATTSGTCTLTIQKAADSTYNVATTTMSFTFSRASQTIIFNPLSPRTLGTGNVGLSATASSGLAVTLASTNNSICSISDTTVTLITAGLCSITASQAGNANYDSATATRSFTISETLTITTPSSGLSGTYGSSYSLTLTPSGGSGNNSFSLIGTLPDGLSLIDRGETATITGTPTTPGSSLIQVQVSDSNGATATTNSFTITISKATTSLSSFTISSKTYGNAPFTLTAPTVTGSLAGTFTYSSSNTLIATISDSAVTIVKAGSVTITALFTPTDSANYETSTITATLTIDKANQASLLISSDTTVAFGSTLTLTT